jgi:hypothetical protein
MGYAAGMSQTLERRVEDLERKYFALSEQVLDMRRRKKDWRGTFGTLEDDAMTREAERLGREYRKQQTYDKELAGP